MRRRPLLQFAAAFAVTLGTATTGSATHLNAEKFRLRAGMEGTHIPFKGSPEAVADVMTGRVDFYFAPVAPVLPLIKAGKLTALVKAGGLKAN